MNIPRTFLYLIFCSFISAFSMIEITYAPEKNGRGEGSCTEDISLEEGLLIVLPTSNGKSNPELSKIENSAIYQDLLGISFDEEEQIKIKQQIRMYKLKNIIEEEERRIKKDPFRIFD